MNRFGIQALGLAAAFAAGAAVAGLFGAASLGVAFGVGQIAFLAALVWVLVKA